MILHHLVTNGYQGTITRKQSCSVLPPAPNLNWFHPHAEPRSAFKFHVMSAEESGTGTRKYSTHPPGSRSHPFPSLPPSVPPVPTPRRSAPRAPSGRAGLGARNNRGPRAATAPYHAPSAPRGRGGPAAGLSPPVGPGRAEHRDRRNTGIGGTAGAAPQQPPPPSRAVLTSVERLRGRPRRTAPARAPPSAGRGEGGAGRGRERRAV